MTTLAERLKSARLKMGPPAWSQRELGRQANIDIAQVSRIESGQFTEPKAATLGALAGALGVSLAWLRDGTEERQANDVRAPETGPAARGEVTAPHGKIHASPFNPRKRFDPATIAELAASIAAEGLLQNLVVRPHPTLPGEYEIAAGERRWRAIAALIAEGRWSPAAPIPLQIRDLSDRQLLKLAAAENIQRNDMHPLEEAAAIAQLADMAQEGDGTTEEIAGEFGRTQRWVQLMIALDRKLADEVKEAFYDGRIGKEQARAFTLADKKVQAAALKSFTWEIEKGSLTADRVKVAMTANMIPVKSAHFSLSLYTGEIVDDGEDRFLTDIAQFHELQNAAVEATMTKLAKKWAWVERHNGYWGYSEKNKFGASTDRALAGAIVVVKQDGVQVVTGLLKPAQVKAFAAAKQSGLDLAPGEAPPPVPGEPYTQAFLADCKMRKTAAMQDALMNGGGADAAMRLVCLALLGGERAVRIKATEPGTNNGVLALSVADALSEAAPAFGLKLRDVDASTTCPITRRGFVGEETELRYWRALEAMPYIKISALFTALVAARIGTFSSFKPELHDDAVAAEIARHLDVTHGERLDAAAETFQVDDAFLQGYRKPGLIKAAIASAAFQPGDEPALEKMTAAKIRAAVTDECSTLVNREWIPDELRFHPKPVDAAEPPDDHALEDEDEEDGDPAADPADDEPEIGAEEAA